MTTPDLSAVGIADLVSLRGRVAVVTGGASGIGRGIATRFAEADATVVVADIDQAAATEAAANIPTGTAAVVGKHLDVTDTTQVTSLVGDVVESLGGLDIWVNNAGIFPPTPVLEMSDAEWSRVLDVNLNGAFMCSREAARAMVGLGRPGVLLNIASVSAYRGRKALAHYSASKHAIRGLTRSLAVELGSSDIRVLAIAPTMITTPGTATAASNRETSDSTVDRSKMHSTDVYAQLPLGRAGVPDDVARVALFCVSDLAALMTGSTLAVDAGQMSM